MRIQVQLFAYMRQYAPGDTDAFDLELLEGSTVESVFRTLGIPAGLLIFVKVSSLLLGRRFALTDVLFAVLGIAAAAVLAYLVGLRKRSYGGKLRIMY